MMIWRLHGSLPLRVDLGNYCPLSLQTLTFVKTGSLDDRHGVPTLRIGYVKMRVAPVFWRVRLPFWDLVG
jgi:hypothetical protein